MQLDKQAGFNLHKAAVIEGQYDVVLKAHFQVIKVLKDFIMKVLRTTVNRLSCSGLHVMMMRNKLLSLY